jgi:YNFM family putative membrane transporter
MPVILVTTVLTLSALYVPQPLLPVLAEQFSVSREMAALLTTIVFVPLCLAPLVYGYLLESVSARKILRIAMLLLGLSSIAIGFVDSFEWLLGWRLFQGLLIPALLTALMTYSSQSAAKGEMQRVMAWYIGATIAGGFAGRALSGAIASLFHWRGSFFALGVGILIAWFWLAKLPESGVMHMHRPRFGLIREILSNRIFLRTYLMIFCFFLAFAAVRLVERRGPSEVVWWCWANHGSCPDFIPSGPDPVGRAFGCAAAGDPVSFLWSNVSHPCHCDRPAESAC